MHRHTTKVEAVNELEQLSCFQCTLLRGGMRGRDPQSKARWCSPRELVQLPRDVDVPRLHCCWHVAIGLTNRVEKKRTEPEVGQ